jgi:hypothetical protein
MRIDPAHILLAMASLTPRTKPARRPPPAVDDRSPPARRVTEVLPRAA